MSVCVYVWVCVCACVLNNMSEYIILTTFVCNRFTLCVCVCVCVKKYDWVYHTNGLCTVHYLWFTCIIYIYTNTHIYMCMYTYICMLSCAHFIGTVTKSSEMCQNVIANYSCMPMWFFGTVIPSSSAEMCQNVIANHSCMLIWCMHECAHTYMHACTHTYIHTYIHT